MKRSVSTLLIGMILGALLFSGLTVFADLAVSPSTQKVFVDGKEVTVDAYNINGSNYFKARDFAAAMDIGMWYNDETRSVMIETDKGYDASYTGHTDADAGTPTTVPASGISFGSAFPHGDWDVTLTSISFENEIAADSMGTFMPGEGKVYLLVHATIKNNGSEKGDFSFFNITVMLNGVTEVGAVAMIGADKNITYASTVMPGYEKSGYFAFPVDAAIESNPENAVLFISTDKDTEYAVAWPK